MVITVITRHVDGIEDAKVRSSEIEPHSMLTSGTECSVKHEHICGRPIRSIHYLKQARAPQCAPRRCDCLA